MKIYYQIVIFTIIITITVVDLLNISIHNTNGFTMNYYSFRLHFILLQEIFLVN